MQNEKATHSADIDLQFTVKFTDNGKDTLKDQAWAAIEDALGFHVGSDIFAGGFVGRVELIRKEDSHAG
ncbi:MAG: hypothetical protein CL555_05915 [Algoriphagus sp.]|nr:hypothetical protein [Algoriphagus sp.]QDP64437.1 MAG: hypothetical protein Tp156MES38741_28 [Prokaryotic dsDNA virus sp.]|tara:strand:+ start:1481 stop:1687 length:207 start_codon:yes stop_codon:yes gene_type:complete